MPALSHPAAFASCEEAGRPRFVSRDLLRRVVVAGSPPSLKKIEPEGSTKLAAERTTRVQ